MKKCSRIGLMIASCLFATAHAGAQGCGAPLFRGVASEGVVDDPLGLEVVDLDKDGDPDVVATDVDNGLVVMMNDGSGVFATVAEFPLAEPFGLFLLQGVCSLDYDGDGWVDIAHVGDDIVRLFRNDGTGALVEDGSFAADGAHAVAAGDLTGDGLVDILVGSPNQAHIAVSDGSGGFVVEADPVAVGNFGFITRVEVLRLNGDLAADIAISANISFQSSPKLFLFTSGPGGEYTATTVSTYGQATFDTGDFDRDGTVDFAVQAGGTPASLLLYEGLVTLNGAYTLELRGDFDSIAGFDVAVADFNADGIADVLSGEVLRLGLGGFELGPPVILEALVDPVFRHRAADFDGDGLLDVVAMESGTMLLCCGDDPEPDSLTVLVNSGASASGPEVWPSHVLDHGLNSGDLDGDGSEELLAAGAGIRIHSAGAGGELLVVDIVLPGIEFRTAVAVDLDGDAALEIVAAEASSPMVRVLDLQGARWVEVDSFASGLATIRHLAPADVDGDGVMELIASGPAKLQTLFRDGPLTLAPGPVTVTSPAAFWSHLATGDLDADGYADVVVSALQGAPLAILMGVGDGTFTSPPFPQAYERGGPPVIADFDADGDDDLLFVAVDPPNPSGAALVLARGEAGGLLVPELFPIDASFGSEVFIPRAMTAADIDLDGAMDVVVVYADDDATRECAVLLNDGTGGLHGLSGLASAPAPFAGPDRRVIAADITGDGVPEVVAASANALVSYSICGVEAVCPSDLDGSGLTDSADLNILLAGFGCVGGLCAGDIDGDGDTDSADLNVLLGAFGSACR